MVKVAYTFAVNVKLPTKTFVTATSRRFFAIRYSTDELHTWLKFCGFIPSTACWRWWNVDRMAWLLYHRNLLPIPYKWMIKLDEYLVKKGLSA